MEKEEPVVRFLKQRINRRQAIKVGGLASLGLVFSNPLIEAIHPKPAFANYINSNTHSGSSTADWTDPEGAPNPGNYQEGNPTPDNMGSGATEGSSSHHGNSNTSQNGGASAATNPSGSNTGDDDPSRLRGLAPNAPARALEPLGDNLVRLWQFDNATKKWTFYNPWPAHTEANGIMEMVPNQIYLLELKRDQMVVLNDKLRMLYAVWSYIVW